ncbi:MAG TPA: hypothetical protein DDY88_09590 [Actinobacteria bacterium]|nr:hypothetical protein [Actinomycetota bacterium]
MGRKNRRQIEPGSQSQAASYGLRYVEDFGGEDWIVQTITGAAATKPYRCPGCDHEIHPGTPHVVAFPADGLGGVDARRHWHKTCWASRHTRGPRHQRGSRY